MASRPAPLPPAVGRDVVGDGFDLLAGVGGGDGEAAGAHDGQVDDVVADIGELIDGDVGLGENLVDGVHLVGLALIDELQLQIVGADGDGLRLALGDDADAQATETGERDAETVVGGEAFGFDSMAVGTGNDEDLAVGEDAVDVEDEDFDVFCAGFSSHLTMIPCARWEIQTTDEF